MTARAKRVGWRVLCLFFCFSFACSKTLIADDGSGGFAGTLIDPNNHAVTGLDGVKVVLTNSATGAAASGAVDHDGTFEIRNLAAGIYDLSLPIPCCTYTSYQQKSVVIASGETLRIDLHIGWGMNLGTIGDDPVQLGADMRAKTKNVTGPVPRTRDGHPDLTGVWSVVQLPRSVLAPNIPMQPWAAEMWQKLISQLTGQQFNAGVYCLPQFAVPTVGPYPFKFVQTPREIVQIIEFVTPAVRQIFMDGRGHPNPNEWNPAWYGHSTGRWQGDTLVVDTFGFNETTPGFAIHSEKLHVVERFHRVNRGTLEIELTADDADAWTGIYTRKLTAGLADTEEIQEWVCAENNEFLGPIGWKGRP